MKARDNILIEVYPEDRFHCIGFVSCTCVLTVKLVFKGHSGERAPCDHGIFSKNGVLSPPC